RRSPLRRRSHPPAPRSNSRARRAGARRGGRSPPSPPAATGRGQARAGRRRLHRLLGGLAPPRGVALGLLGLLQAAARGRQQALGVVHLALGLPARAGRGALGSARLLELGLRGLAALALRGMALALAFGGVIVGRLGLLRARLAL